MKVRLAVLYGGRSAEHDVSCVSALNVARSIDRDRYHLRVVGITTSGVWLDATNPALEAIASEAASLPSPDLLVAPAELSLPPTEATGPAPDGTSTARLRPELVTDWPREAAPSATEQPGEETRTVVLPLLHGPMGEDGTLQGLLELAGVAYCGPGVAGSAAAMDKGLAKALLDAAGLPQARYLYLQEDQADAGVVNKVETVLGWPVFVKPANMGSSIGITKVKSADGLRTALEHALRYDAAVVIEEAIVGRELEIGVLGWPELRTSVPGEIKPTADFYDYNDKYVSGTAGLEVPADLDRDVASEMGTLALQACRALRVDSMARVDFLYEANGRGLLINEVNAIPGFTPISMYPQVWAASGVPYGRLIDELVDMAWRRHVRRLRFETGR